MKALYRLSHQSIELNSSMVMSSGRVMVDDCGGGAGEINLGLR